MRSSFDADNARKLLAGVRFANGAAALVAPGFLARRLGLDPKVDRGVTYALQLFGVRTVLIAVELVAQDPELRARAVDAAVAVHASDTMAAVVAGLSGRLPRRGAVMAIAISSVNVALALRARRGQIDPSQ
jgi:hypothetical protein